MQNHSTPLVPFPFTGNKSDKIGKCILAGDVGGTKTNLAFYNVKESGLEAQKTISYPSADFASVIHMLEEFTEQGTDRPASICLGVAGPVLNGKVELTNLNWDLDIAEIKAATGISSVSLLNDLEATAYGLAAFTQDDFITIHEGTYQPGNIAILSPGTGLGEAGLYFDGAAYHPFPTEGGHCDFCPRTEFDFELTRYLQRIYGIVSWEKLISGSGIIDIYSFLKEERSLAEPVWLRELMQENDAAATISKTAMQEKADICVETMNVFIRYLARESSNLVLKMKAVGGLFLGGGIPPKIAGLIDPDQFMKDFLDCDRMQHLLAEVPIRIITNQKAPVVGAAYFAAYGS